MWALGIFIIISLPGSSIPKSRFLNIENIDKVIHFLLFFVFSLLLSFGFFRQQVLENAQKHYVVYTLVISIFYGALTEFFQAVMLPSRFGNFWDFLANSAGAISGILVFKVLLEGRFINKTT